MYRTWLAVLAALTLAVPSTATAANRNVVVIVADDLGLDLGCYGDTQIKTPSLDALAARGTRFTNAFCTTASCSASRSVILTGLQNHANGQYGHQHGEANFHTFANLKGLPVLLSAAGYRTVRIGKLHVQPDEVYHFDVVLPDGPGGGSRNPVGMAEQVKGFLAETGDQPFFLYFCPTDPHRAAKGFANERPYPGIEPIRYDPETIRVPSYLPDSPEARAEWAGYAQAVSRFDQGVGRLMQVLEQAGRLDETLILFLSDNGPPFPGAKTSLYEPGMRLPLIVRSPDHKTQGGTTDALVNWADLVPTILEYTGAKGPAYPLHGCSFLSVLDTPKAEGWDQVFASHTFHEVTMYYPMRAVRDRRYKLILNVAHPLEFPFASDLFAAETWQGVLRRKESSYGRRTVEALLHRPRFELYDLQADPDETRNLADSPDHAAILADLQARLVQFQRQTKDPWIVKYEHE